MISRWHEGGVQDAGNSLVLAIEIVYIIDNLMLFHQAIRTYDFYTFYKYDIIKQKYVVKKIYSWIKDKTGAWWQEKIKLETSTTAKIEKKKINLMVYRLVKCEFQVWEHHKQNHGDMKIQKIWTSSCSL